MEHIVVVINTPAKRIALILLAQDHVNLILLFHIKLMTVVKKNAYTGVSFAIINANFQAITTKSTLIQKILEIWNIGYLRMMEKEN